MNRTSCRPDALSLALCAIVLLPPTVRGLVVPMTDGDLVSSSTAIVLGNVRSVFTHVTSAAGIETRVTVAVEDQFKGPPEGTVMVSVPGGAIGNVRRVVLEAPFFYVGERVVLFLRHRPDRMLILNGLTMGKYTIMRLPTGDVARRQLGGGNVAFVYDSASGKFKYGMADEQRPLDALLDTIRRLVAGRPADLESGEAAGLRDEPDSRFGDAFTFIGSPPARWIEPDRGAAVTYEVDAGGDSTLGVWPSLTAVLDAMTAWNVSGSSLRLLQGGWALPTPFNGCDGKSTIQFNDPFGEIGPPVNCTGVLAIGGYCATDFVTSTVNDMTFMGITEGDIAINSGFGECPFWTATNLAEVLAHELGHTVGLGHSSENPGEADSARRDATMFFLAHFDGRGASLRDDDRRGLLTLYPGLPTPDPLRVQFFSMDGSNDAVLLNARVQFPSGSGFNPLHESISVELRDSGGMLYSGRVHARRLPSRRRLPATYAAHVRSDTGRGVMAFRWNDSTGTLVLRASCSRLALATGKQTVLVLQLGERMLVKHLFLQQAVDGSWFCGGPHP